MHQLKLPLEIEKLIDISDPVYTFCEVMDHIDLSRYFVEKGYKTGRPRCDEQKLLKVILFAFMENGICSLREIEKFCRNDTRYMYLLDGMKAPSFATFGNLIRNELTNSVEQIFMDINTYIFAKDHVDLQHTYIDGTKIEANANRYTWVWKKSCMRNRQKVRYNKYGRTEEIYECESCEGCPHKQECCPKARENRTIRMNQELTSIHQEVLTNLESIHGALLRMNRSIQAEGTFGVLKWDKSYKRLFRRGEKNVILELTLISCGFNLYKYHNKKQRQLIIA